LLGSDQLLHHLTTWIGLQKNDGLTVEEPVDSAGTKFQRLAGYPVLNIPVHKPEIGSSVFQAWLADSN
jgi:hypothetical protein